MKVVVVILFITANLFAFASENISSNKINLSFVEKDTFRPHSHLEEHNFYVNIYGQIPFKKLLDTTWFAKYVTQAERTKRMTESASWLYLNSFWSAKEGEGIYEHFDLQNPLWKDKLYVYEEGIPNKKDFKLVTKFLSRYLLYEVKEGPELSMIYDANTYSTITGTAFLTYLMYQLQWPYKIYRNSDHLFLRIPGEKEEFILDCSNYQKFWQVSDSKSPYLDFLKARGYLDQNETSLSKFIEQSEIISYNQLVALQKVAESKALESKSPVAAFYRMEVAHYFWPENSIRGRWIEMSKNVYQSSEVKNDWDKIYAILTYIKLTGDQSASIKTQFNSILSNALIYYSEYEDFTMGRPVFMPIRIHYQYASDSVMIKDTMHRLAAFDYDNYVNFELLEPKVRGLFHALSFESSISRSATDFQFYVDALYIYEYLEHSDSLLSILYNTNLIGYNKFDDMPFILKDHYEHGALTESTYHEMATIFYLGYLDLNGPKNVNDANDISMESLRYGVYQDELADHLVFVKNSFLLKKAKEYVERMIPFYKNKFISHWEGLNRIAQICQMEIEVVNDEDLAPTDFGKEMIRRMSLINKELEKKKN